MPAAGKKGTLPIFILTPISSCSIGQGYLFPVNKKNIQRIIGAEGEDVPPRYPA
jgi:hypothetical protein